MTGHVVGVTEGFSGPFPALASASFSDATGFSTKKPMNFEDFQNTLVLYTNLSISFFLGYSQSYILSP